MLSCAKADAEDGRTAGIVFDTLHYVRSGSTPDMLKEIPGDRVHCVQLNDGPLRLPAGVALEENCFDRSWPGAGEFPLIEIVRTLADMDALRQVSPEVFSSRYCQSTGLMPSRAFRRTRRAQVTTRGRRGRVRTCVR